MAVSSARLPFHLGVVVVNYGSHRLIEANLAQFDAIADEASIVVVNNFTSRTEAISIAQLCARFGWNLVSCETNLGFGAAMNLGVGEARKLGAEIFLLINPDANISVDGAVALAHRVAERPTTMVSPTIVLPDGSPWFSGASVLVDKGITTTRPGSKSDAPNGWLTGACVLLHHSLWAKSGGFDEDYFLYWEDVDFSWKCVDVGGQLQVASDIYATHSVGGTQRSRGKSPRYAYYNCRNRLIFAKKHLNASARRRWVATSITYARSVVLRGGPRNFARDAIPLCFAALFGTVSGLSSLLRLRHL